MKSPSVKRRDVIRKLKYNIKKKDQEFMKEKIELTLKIQKLEKECKKKFKLPKRMVCILPPIDIQPTKFRKLSEMKTSQIDIQPMPRPNNLSFTQPTICSLPPYPPKPKFHPHIVEACQQIYGKQPEELSQEETEHFSGYMEWKIRNGTPIEEDSLYKPRDEPP
jgi:hypothetical protein